MTHTLLAYWCKLYVGSLTVSLGRLDSLLPDLLDERDRVCLKLDVQGAEMQVLEGASGALDKIEAVEAELSVVPLYGGQPLFYEMNRAPLLPRLRAGVAGAGLYGPRHGPAPAVRRPLRSQAVSR